jgi:YggT family protein
MGVAATLTVLSSAISEAETFINVFVTIYTLVILLYIITSWLRLPYSPWLNRIQRFLYDVCEPYLRFWRRLLPFAVGPMDFTPIVAILAIGVFTSIIDAILNRFF